MTDGFIVPLFTTAVLGICFGTTRWMGIAATALLTFRHPWLVIIVIAIAIFFHLKLRK